MDDSKRERLKDNGWRFGDAEDFLSDIESNMELEDLNTYSVIQPMSVEDTVKVMDALDEVEKDSELKKQRAYYFYGTLNHIPNETTLKALAEPVRDKSYPTVDEMILDIDSSHKENNSSLSGLFNQIDLEAEELKNVWQPLLDAVEDTRWREDPLNLMRYLSVTEWRCKLSDWLMLLSIWIEP